ncbi:hypothetical protein SDC9_208476 [bioreactor metagenome]|uniref:Uncharacterized protein n=1 Tax=bioreactor metagenome TaxID=1076179 RepID=A0A645JK91_9ZZZZ
MAGLFYEPGKALAYTNNAQTAFIFIATKTGTAQAGQAPFKTLLTFFCSCTIIANSIIDQTNIGGAIAKPDRPHHRPAGRVQLLLPGRGLRAGQKHRLSHAARTQLHPAAGRRPAGRARTDLCAVAAAVQAADLLRHQ